MDQFRASEELFRLEHRHADGSWAVMREVQGHHGQAEHDPERRWGIRRIFRCTRCEESATIVEGAEGGARGP